MNEEGRFNLSSRSICWRGSPPARVAPAPDPACPVGGMFRARARPLPLPLPSLSIIRVNTAFNSSVSAASAGNPVSRDRPFAIPADRGSRRPFCRIFKYLRSLPPTRGPTEDRRDPSPDYTERCGRSKVPGTDEAGRRGDDGADDARRPAAAGRRSGRLRALKSFCN